MHDARPGCFYVVPSQQVSDGNEVFEYIQI